MSDETKKDPIGYVYIDENKMPIKFAFNPAALCVYMSDGCRVNVPDIDGGYIAPMFIGEPPVSPDERAQIRAEALTEVAEELLNWLNLSGENDYRRGIHFSRGYLIGRAVQPKGRDNDR